ncbi:hypothetical protein EJO69_11095 [Flaviflexus salsibiostraticola]|uniref:Bacteriocin transport accessory protein n=2 Tax=Flaviflexus salsibiostraticola TaxID=1282737 RepID=A0A3Q8WXC5_9ACTO|nr:hypothetical protein EJO69_11095 [Flaviflexus salsibiostraticola]
MGWSMIRRFRHIAALLAATLMLGACSSGSDDPFVQEYESLNGEEARGGRAYLELDIRDEHRFRPSSEDEIRNLLDDGDGAIYFGFPECPWCRSAVGPMDEAAEAVNLDEIHYLNVSEIRDQKSVNASGDVIVTDEGTDFYGFLLDELGDFAPEYPDVPGERRILVPLVAIVVGGEIVDSHLGTVESQTDPYEGMTDEQRTELIDLYREKFSQIPGCGEFYCE